MQPVIYAANVRAMARIRKYVLNRFFLIPTRRHKYLTVPAFVLRSQGP